MIGLTALAAGGGAVALISAPPASAATVSPPTLAVSFTPGEIGVTDSTGIAYTITNPNSSGSLANVSFTDTLPNVATIDDPTGLASSGCGSPTIGAGADNGVDGATGITVKAGTPCVITLSVVGDSIGTSADTLGALSYTTTGGAVLTAPSANETAATLTVLAAPTATIAAPRNGAKYAYGEKVTATFACTAPDDASGPTLSACLATDDLGNTITSGADLDTTVPGVHTLDVEAQDTDTDTADAQVSYTVLPNNRDALRSATVAANGGVRLTLAVPGAGTIGVTETHGDITVASKRLTVLRPLTALSVPLVPSPAARKLLKAGQRVRVILSVTYTPKGGTAHKLTRVLSLG